MDECDPAARVLREQQKSKTQGENRKIFLKCRLCSIFHFIFKKVIVTVEKPRNTLNKDNLMIHNVFIYYRIFFW